MNATKPVRCPDCIAAPADHVSEFGHLITDPDTGATTLAPHTGCPNPDCRHGEWSHDSEVGCTARWFAGGPTGCPCLLGPDWTTATVWAGPSYPPMADPAEVLIDGTTAFERGEGPDA